MYYISSEKIWKFRGYLPLGPPPPSGPMWGRKKRVCKRIRVFALIYTREGSNFGHNIKGNNWT